MAALFAVPAEGKLPLEVFISRGEKKKQEIGFVNFNCCANLFDEATPGLAPAVRNVTCLHLGRFPLVL